MIDYYDLTLVGVLAGTVWPALFFAKGSYATSFATSAGMTLGVTMLSRPFGSIIFGHFGDRIGRKNTLIATLVFAGIGTLGIAFAPTYATSGELGIILILACRCLFGVSMGGEMGGAIAWTSEAGEVSKTTRRGLASGTLGIFAGVGIILSSALVLLVSNVMSAHSYQDWGWRLLLLIATVILALGGVARYWVSESPLFQEVKGRATESATRKFPLFGLLAAQWRPVLIMSFIGVAGTVLAWLNTSFLSGYLSATKSFSMNLFFTALLIGGIGVAAVSAVCGYCSDIFGRRPTLLVCLLGCVVFGPVGMLVLVPSKTVALTLLAAFLFELPVGGQGAFFPLYAESFPTVYRQTGAGLTYQLGNLWEGLIFVLVFPYIYGRFGITGSLLPLSIVCVVMAAVGLVALWYTRETRGRALESGLDDTDPSI
jgi:MFS family permease